MKNLKSKIEMSKFAFTTYEKTLSDLRFALRGGNFDRTEFLSSMEAIDGIVIDLGLDWEKLRINGRKSFRWSENDEKTIEFISQGNEFKLGRDFR